LKELIYSRNAFSLSRGGLMEFNADWDDMAGDGMTEEPQIKDVMNELKSYFMAGDESEQWSDPDIIEEEVEMAEILFDNC